ncbi:hypothetical protein BC833DRAFT_626549 [Globomyces pollinis-pini]|nr:hypothetical protein BC833DRAFT_626549 [Globomyces pollinis-pini]
MEHYVKRLGGAVFGDYLMLCMLKQMAGKKLSKEELEQKKEYIGDNYRPEEDDATEKRWTKRETTEKAKPLRTGPKSATPKVVGKMEFVYFMIKININ